MSETPRFNNFQAKRLLDLNKELINIIINLDGFRTTMDYLNRDFDDDLNTITGSLDNILKNAGVGLATLYHIISEENLRSDEKQ